MAPPSTCCKCKQQRYHNCYNPAPIYVQPNTVKPFEVTWGDTTTSIKTVTNGTIWAGEQYTVNNAPQVNNPQQYNQDCKLAGTE